MVLGVEHTGMSEEGDTEPGASSSAAEAAFSLVANETRMEILRELWEADGALSFSTLRERVGLRDSGQFNYHLNKLVGTFVRKEDGGDEPGYGLEYPGIRVLGAVYSGVLTREASVEPVPADGECLDCGGELAASYGDNLGQVACTSCDLEVMEFPIPPGAVEGRDPEALPRLYDAWTRRQLERFVDGFCPQCAGPTSASLVDAPTEEWERWPMHGLVLECDRCGFHVQSLPGSAVLSHPRVVAFHLDHDVDLSETRLWDLDWLYDPHTEVHEREPPRFDVHVDLGDERLVVAVDESLAVIDTDSRPRPDESD
jgi:hypothetical protein